VCTPVTSFPPIDDTAYHQYAGGRPATGIGNMHKNWVKIPRVVPEISSRADRQTDTQTDILITVLSNNEVTST